MRPKFKPFKYKAAPRPPKFPLNRLQTTNEGERLTGFVNGKEASDLEERFARALSTQGRDFIFQYEFVGPATIPGQENIIDFVVDDIWPTEVDGTFVHKSAAKKADDQLRDAILNEHFADDGWSPIRRVPGSELEDQDEADRIVREMWP